MERYARLKDIYLEHPLGGGDGGLLLEILKLLYTPEEAGLIAAIGFDPLSLEEISEAAGLPGETANGMLRDILQRRGIYFGKKGGIVRYSLYEPFPGLMMFPLMYAIKSGEAEKLRSLLEEYFRSRFGGEDVSRRIVPVRALPWGGVLPVGRGEIQGQFKVERLIESAGEAAGRVCPYTGASGSGPLFKSDGVRGETTFLFDGAARFAADAGLGVSVKGGDLLGAVEMGVKKGVVLLTSRFAEGVDFLCCARADSCIFLKGVKESVFPGTAINSGFAVRVNAGDCTACGMCREVCPVNAIRIGNVARIDDERCIGCGLCVDICPPKAMMLIKERGVQVRLPRNREELMKRAHKEG